MNKFGLCTFFTFLLLFCTPALSDTFYELNDTSNSFAESFNYNADYEPQDIAQHSSEYNSYAIGNKPQKYADNRKYTKKRSYSSYGYGEKVIVIDPRAHTWAAYSASGQLLRSGIATAGAKWCPDIQRACRTKSGVFRISSLGSSSCKSTRYPVGRGGAPMPYCMFFNGNQGLHGSHEVARANLSHGCVRVTVSDAKWIRFNFATHGTKVIVKSY